MSRILCVVKFFIKSAVIKLCHVSKFILLNVYGVCFYLFMQDCYCFIVLLITVARSVTF